VRGIGSGQTESSRRGPCKPDDKRKLQNRTETTDAGLGSSRGEWESHCVSASGAVARSSTDATSKRIRRD
jgi:hypothetical protein